MKEKINEFIKYVIYEFRDFIVEANFNRRHLIYSFENWKINIKFPSHADFVEQTREEIEQYRENEKDIKEVIKFSLKKALGDCNFIIFTDDCMRLKKLHFWTGRGKLELNFPTDKVNKLGKYKLLILGLLVTLGFEGAIHSPGIIDRIFIKSKFYGFQIVQEENEDIQILANFNKNIDLTAEFILKVFKDFYRTNLKDITITIN